VLRASAVAARADRYPNRERGPVRQFTRQSVSCGPRPSPWARHTESSCTGSGKESVARHRLIRCTLDRFNRAVECIQHIPGQHHLPRPIPLQVESSTKTRTGGDIGIRSNEKPKIDRRQSLLICYEQVNVDINAMDCVLSLVHAQGWPHMYQGQPIISPQLPAIVAEQADMPDEIRQASCIGILSRHIIFPHRHRLIVETLCWHLLPRSSAESPRPALPTCPR